jgi:hypothetical protein
MDLTPYVEGLRRDLLTAAAAGTDEIRRTADLLATALDPAVRLAILDALSAAMADVTAALPDVTVELRMHGREPRVAVDTVEPEPAAPVPAAEEADGTARITLRLPESIKARTEEAASREGVSVNSWLVRAVVQALDGPRPGSARAGRRITGYARG